jgi:L-iditol 2-dehydrogenase
MKTAYLTGLNRMEVRMGPGPRATGPHDVLLRINTVGVCGSDIHYYKQGRVGTQIVGYPFVIGHECAATIVETGSEVRDLEAGQRVAIDPLVPCGQCDQC